VPIESGRDSEGRLGVFDGIQSLRWSRGGASEFDEINGVETPRPSEERLLERCRTRQSGQ
jgi:hypothetical protein